MQNCCCTNSLWLRTQFFVIWVKPKQGGEQGRKIWLSIQLQLIVIAIITILKCLVIYVEFSSDKHFPLHYCFGNWMVQEHHRESLSQQCTFARTPPHILILVQILIFSIPQINYYFIFIFLLLKNKTFQIFSRVLIF